MTAHADPTPAQAGAVDIVSSALRPEADRGGLVLITGASGFVGSHLLDRLVAEGRRVRCLMRQGGASSFSPLVEHCPGDLLDAESLRRAMDGVAVVYHLAGVAAVSLEAEAINRTLMVNVVGTMNLLEAARRQGVRRVVLVSSGHIYGSARRLPIAEDHEACPQSPYATTKLAAETLGLNYHDAHGLPVVVLRPFNIYGPRQSVAAVIPTIITQALDQGPVLLRTLRPRRDFLFVEDMVDGLIRAGAAPQAVGRTINLGAGCDVSVAELVRRVLRLTGAEATMPDQPVFDNDDDRNFADNGLAHSLLGWKPLVSLDEGLRRTVLWWRERRGIDASRTEAAST